MTKTNVGMHKVLHEHLCKLRHVGEVRATRIIEWLGGAEAAIEKLDANPTALIEIPGLRLHTAQMIARDWKTKRPQLEAAINHHRRAFE